MKNVLTRQRTRCCFILRIFIPRLFFVVVVVVSVAVVDLVFGVFVVVYVVVSVVVDLVEPSSIQVMLLVVLSVIRCWIDQKIRSVCANYSLLIINK